jgi:hypothetical protein
MLTIFLIVLVVVNAIFGRTVFGLNAQKVLLVILLILLGAALYYAFIHQEPYEVLLKTDHITITKPITGNTVTFPFYGKTTEYYYIVYPTIHYRTPVHNSCIGFNQFNIDTWCGDDRYIPRCNTPLSPETCTMIMLRPK